jgi:hypothetical protein
MEMLRLMIGDEMSVALAPLAALVHDTHPFVFFALCLDHHHQGHQPIVSRIAWSSALTSGVTEAASNRP